MGILCLCRSGVVFAAMFPGHEADERSSLGIAPRRCRRQMKAGRNFRSGRKNRGERKPEDFFGHRKVARSDNPETEVRSHLRDVLFGTDHGLLAAQPLWPTLKICHRHIFFTLRGSSPATATRKTEDTHWVSSVFVVPG